MGMSLSVITIFFKEEEKVLQQFLESLYSTIHALSFEVILINNSEKTLDAVKNNYPNIQIIENKENLGVASSRNQGVSFGKGEALFFLHSDMMLSLYASYPAFTVT